MYRTHTVQHFETGLKAEVSISQTRLLNSEKVHRFLQGNLVSFINWLCGQLRRPSNPQCSVPAAVSALGSLLKEAPVRELFTRTGADLNHSTPQVCNTHAHTPARLFLCPHLHLNCIMCFHSVGWECGLRNDSYNGKAHAGFLKCPEYEVVLKRFHIYEYIPYTHVVRSYYRTEEDTPKPPKT